MPKGDPETTRYFGDFRRLGQKDCDYFVAGKLAVLLPEWQSIMWKFIKPARKKFRDAVSARALAEQ
ncbi:MAG: hypothetical protein K9L85_00110 [Candidatus Peribacteraceae bacterium]|nr:hypothetical protein [Candidatus Peribacteraceae bacterium]